MSEVRGEKMQVPNVVTTVQLVGGRACVEESRWVGSSKVVMLGRRDDDGQTEDCLTSLERYNAEGVGGTPVVARVSMERTRYGRTKESVGQKVAAIFV